MLRISVVVLALLGFTVIAAEKEARPRARQEPQKATTVPTTRLVRFVPFLRRTMEARIARARADVVVLRGVVIAFEVGVGRYPTEKEGLGALAVQPANANGWRGPYLEGMPVDPWGQPYVYHIPGKRNPKSFDVSSNGPDGKPDTDDDITH